MSEETENLYNSTKEELRNRIKNPFISSVIISWIICNYRLILYLSFSKDIIEDKLDNMCNYYTFWSMIIFPITYAFMIIFISPRILELINLLNKNVFIRNKKHDEELSKISAIEELNDKMKKLASNNSQITIEKGRINEELITAKNELISFKEMYSNAEINTKELYNKIEKQSILIFSYYKNLIDNNKFIENIDLLSKSGINSEILRNISRDFKFTNNKIDNFLKYEHVLLKLEIIFKFGKDDYEFNEEAFDFYIDFLNRK